MLKVLNLGRKGVSSKAERLRKQIEDEKIKQYERMNMLKDPMLAKLMSGRPLSPFNRNNNYGDMTTKIAMKMEGMSLA